MNTCYSGSIRGKIIQGLAKARLHGVLYCKAGIGTNLKTNKGLDRVRAMEARNRPSKKYKPRYTEQHMLTTEEGASGSAR